MAEGHGRGGIDSQNGASQKDQRSLFKMISFTTLFM